MASSLILLLKYVQVMALLLLALASASAAQTLRTDPVGHPITRRKDIVNGQTVSPDEQPYVAFQVALTQIFPNGTAYEAFCGGSIIAPSYVLTAGHCFTDNFTVLPGQNQWKTNTDPNAEAGIYIAIAGAPDKTKPESGQMRVVSELWIQKDYVETEEEDETRPGFVKFRLSDDIAILKLAEPFSFSDRVRSLALSPDDSGLKVNADLTTAGWGSLLVRDGVAPNKLQIVTVNHLPNVCAKYLTSGGYEVVPGSGLNDSYYFDDRTMICAGCEEKGTDTCTGDSGGPLFALSSVGGCPVQVGLTSWGIALGGVLCGFSVLPDVNARVSHYISWIESVVGQPVRSTVPLSPTANCENCLSNDFPDGQNCDKASRYDLKTCDIQARLAASFTLSKPACQDRRSLTLKAVIDFSKGFPNASEELKTTLTSGQVVFLYSDQGTGNGVISLPPSWGRNGGLINTPLRDPKVLAAKITFDSKEGSWMYGSSSYNCSSARTFAALYMSNTDKGTPLYRQISLPVRV